MTTVQNDYTLLIESLADSLDVSDSQYEAAKAHYEAVGNWLNDEGSSIAAYEPEIYPQGSFRLGTAIKPLNQEDEYDVDLACELKALSKDRVSQSMLKTLVGDRLRENKKYAAMLEEGNRCWTLHYSEASRFHMDILPAIPDHELNGLANTLGQDIAKSAILITDKDLQRWQRSNPKGFAEWFKSRMKVRFEERRILLAESLRAEVEAIPDFKVRTPLQRSIQILKRHRDIMFKDDRDNRPASIIICTLAAHAYNNESDLVEALEGIIEGMPRHIGRDANGYPFIPNPVNPGENFADRWIKYPERGRKFRGWLTRVSEDYSRLKSTHGLDRIGTTIQESFGDNAGTETMRRFGEAKKAQRNHGSLHMKTGATGAGILGASGVPVKAHSFYGE